MPKYFLESQAFQEWRIVSSPRDAEDWAISWAQQALLLVHHVPEVRTMFQPGLLDNLADGNLGYALEFAPDAMSPDCLKEQALRIGRAATGHAIRRAPAQQRNAGCHRPV